MLFQISVLLVLGAVGTVFLRRLIKRIEEPANTTNAPNGEIDPIEDLAKLPTETEILARWGSSQKRRPPAWLMNRIHPTLEKLFLSYDFIGPSPDFPVFDSNLATAPFPERKDFVQIGRMPDSSAILVKLDSSDPKVYLNDLDAPFPNELMILGRNREDYLRKTWTVG